jgi:hypothetical protein
MPLFSFSIGPEIFFGLAMFAAAALIVVVIVFLAVRRIRREAQPSATRSYLAWGTVFGASLGGSIVVGFSNAWSPEPRANLIYHVLNLVSGAFSGVIYGIVLGSTVDHWIRRPWIRLGFVARATLGWIFGLPTAPHRGPGGNLAFQVFWLMIIGGIFGAIVGAVVKFIIYNKRLRMRGR